MSDVHTLEVEKMCIDFNRDKDKTSNPNIATVTSNKDTLKLNNIQVTSK